MPIYGIDFGCSSSCIAALNRDGEPTVIPNFADASDTLTSAVFFGEDGSILVGSFAKDFIETDGERVVQFVKREIGKPNARTYEFDDKKYTPVEISSLILKRLKQMAEEQGLSVENVVLAVPAYFGSQEAIELKNAALIAGLNIVNIITEPLAISIAYLYGHDSVGKNILVYDLGGTSFDVSILQVSAAEDDRHICPIRIESIGGNSELGGRDWDDKLFDFILQACCDENGLTPDEIDVETRQSIRSRVETTKKKLSYAESAKIRVNVNGAMTTVIISRDEFENLTHYLAEETMLYVEATVQNANNIKIDAVILTGGAAQMPMIQRLVENRFPGRVRLFAPECAVALGAAIYGESLNNTPFPQRKIVDSYSPELIANMIRYSLDHLHDNMVKELIAEVNWEQLTAEQLFDFFIRIRWRYVK